MDIEKYGKIVCAALIYNNCIYMSYKGHYDIFTMEEIGVLRTAPQGFVTENGYFVDRDLGLLIAKYYNQIEYKHNPQDKLLSEDLNKENLKVLKRINKYSYKENNINVDEEKAMKWLNDGAIPTDTVKNILQKSGVWAKFKNKKSEK